MTKVWMLSVHSFPLGKSITNKNISKFRQLYYIYIILSLNRDLFQRWQQNLIVILFILLYPKIASYNLWSIVVHV